MTTPAARKQAFFDYLTPVVRAENTRIRAELGGTGMLSGMLSGVRLAEGLGRYSERGEQYLREVRRMVRSNDLDPAAAGPRG